MCDLPCAFVRQARRIALSVGDDEDRSDRENRIRSGDFVNMGGDHVLSGGPRRAPQCDGL